MISAAGSNVVVAKHKKFSRSKFTTQSPSPRSKFSRTGQEPAISLHEGGCGQPDMLLAAHAKMFEILEEWTHKQRALHAEQERMAEQLLVAHREALEEIQRLGAAASRPDSGFTGAPGAAGGRAASVPRSRPCPKLVEPDEPAQREAPEIPYAARSVSDRIADKFKELTEHEELLEFWRRTNGMHTVDKWVMNYRKHPAGWGALLMIHGVGELTGRLRSKVENYAIYSALFLSMSIALMADPAGYFSTPCADSDWFCEVEKRVFLGGLSIGTAAHMLCIMIAMAFVNALNEAARDSDVYRLLAKGQGFIATLKCERSFLVGAIIDFFAVAASLLRCLKWYEPLAGGVVLFGVVTVIYHRTAKRLFSSCSIMSYWREELGGRPEPNDPYDLQIPVECVHEKSKMNDYVFRHNEIIN